MALCYSFKVVMLENVLGIQSSYLSSRNLVSSSCHVYVYVVLLVEVNDYMLIKVRGPNWSCVVSVHLHLSGD